MTQHIFGLGEILWDLLPSGPRFGGAPANFASTCAGLAGPTTRVHMLGAVGTDELGTAAIGALADRFVDTSLVQQLRQPTGTVDVLIDASGLASYQFADDAAWDHLQWQPGLLEAAAGCAAVCYGTLGQRSEPSRDVIRRFLSATPASCIRILDVNLRSPFYDESLIAESLQFANVLKLSDEELPHVVAAAELGDDADRDDEIGEPEQLRMLVEKFELRCVALTRGPRGAILCAGDQIDTRSSPACRVVDTIGAGDAFAAALVLGLLANASMDAINRTAVSVAAYACTQPGGTMSFPSIDFESDLESDFESDPLNG